MPASVVKTPQDERDWESAKRIVEEQYGTTEGKWGVVMTIFKNKQKAHQKQALQSAMAHRMASRLVRRMLVAKVDPGRQCKLLMRNFRTMVNAAIRKGGEGGMDDLGAIGDALNWLKSIKTQEKASEYMDRARESLSGVKSQGAFLKAFQELLTAAQKMPPKRYPSMGQTAIRNALYDLSDAVVSMVMAKNRAQRAISEPDHYDTNLKSSFQQVQSRLDGFVARQLTQPEKAPKKAPTAKPKPKPEPKPEPPPEPEPEVVPLPEESEESHTDDFGLSGRYKNRSEQGNPKATNPGSKKAQVRHGMALAILRRWGG